MGSEKLLRDGDGENGLVGFHAGCTIQLDFYQEMVHPPIGEVVENLQFVMCGVPVFVAVTANGVYVGML